MPAQDLKTWQNTVKSCAHYCEFTYALHQVVTVIPNTPNRNHRKCAAKKFLEEAKVNLGKSMEERLKLLAANGIVAMDGDEGKAPTEADMPPAKKSKSEDA